MLYVIDFLCSLQFEGNKGDKSQASASSLDLKTNVLFFTQLQKDGIACWNTKKDLTPENVALVAEDHEKIVFPNDLKVRRITMIFSIVYSEGRSSDYHHVLVQNSDRRTPPILPLKIREYLLVPTCYHRYTRNLLACSLTG